MASGRLHLQWLTVGGREVAYNVGYLRDGQYHYLKTSYDAAFRAMSPSTYLRARLIEDLIGAVPPGWTSRVTTRPAGACWA